MEIEIAIDRPNQNLLPNSPKINNYYLKDKGYDYTDISQLGQGIKRNDSVHTSKLLVWVGQIQIGLIQVAVGQQNVRQKLGIYLNDGLTATCMPYYNFLQSLHTTIEKPKAVVIIRN